MEGIMKSGLAVLALSLSVSLVAEGQSPRFAVGARVRVTAPGAALDKHVTTIIDERGDSIVVDIRGRSQTLWLADLTALEVGTGKQTHAKRYGVSGFLLGALTGVVIGLATYEECVPQGWFGCFMDGPEYSAVGGLILGGAAGAVIGGAVGSLHSEDVWSSIRLPVRTVVAPTRSGGVSVRMSRAF
ncbi:MAG TPA: hypothetical protein VMM78_02570 [Thermomicrobiales bacterium]|nr:hypothetical protein [Thermomicrobiales bacterium]